MVAGAFSAMMSTGYTGAKTYFCGVVSLTVEEPSAIVTKFEKIRVCWQICLDLP